MKHPWCGVHLSGAGVLEGTQVLPGHGCGRNQWAHAVMLPDAVATGTVGQSLGTASKAMAAVGATQDLKQMQKARPLGAGFLSSVVICLRLLCFSPTPMPACQWRRGGKVGWRPKLSRW